MNLPKIDVSALPDLPMTSGLFAAPSTSIDTDTVTLLMSYLYENS
jgi:hypothetical protein